MSEPLTDEELKELEEGSTFYSKMSAQDINHKLVLRLIAEVRRLRIGLEDAADALHGEFCGRETHHRVCIAAHGPLGGWR